MRDFLLYVQSENVNLDDLAVLIMGIINSLWLVSKTRGTPSKQLAISSPPPPPPDGVFAPKLDRRLAQVGNLKKKIEPIDRPEGRRHRWVLKDGIDYGPKLD